MNWVSTYDETVVWEKVGTIEKAGRSNELRIDFGSGESQFKVRCNANGDFYCIDNNDCPVDAESRNGHGSGTLSGNLFTIELGGPNGYNGTNTNSIKGVK